MKEKELKRKKRKKRKKARKERKEFLDGFIRDKSDREGVEFLSRLLDQVSELKGVYKEHLKICRPMLPHVLMADITRFVIAQHQQELESQTQSPILDSCLDFLEKGMSAGTETDAVQNVISVSFLENLAQSDDLYYSLRDRLGPALRAELKFYEDETGEPPQASQLPESESLQVQNVIRDLFPGRK